MQPDELLLEDSDLEFLYEDAFDGLENRTGSLRSMTIVLSIPTPRHTSALVRNCTIYDCVCVDSASPSTPCWPRKSSTQPTRCRR